MQRSSSLLRPGVLGPRLFSVGEDDGNVASPLFGDEEAAEEGLHLLTVSELRHLEDYTIA